MFVGGDLRYRSSSFYVMCSVVDRFAFAATEGDARSAKITPRFATSGDAPRVLWGRGPGMVELSARQLS